jgi:hypothetical protein
MNPEAYPVRHPSHELETASERFFFGCLPKGWTSQKYVPDYGVDFRVDIYEGQQATGLELLVQLKSSALPDSAETETVRLRTATSNYLRDKLQIVMVVKFVAAEAEAYWLLLRDIPPPSQESETFTVHVPKTNQLSKIEWRDIHALIRDVTDIKLAAIRRKSLTDQEAR